MSLAGGYDSFLEIAPELLGCKYPPEENPEWSNLSFIDNFLPWSIIYLDAVITNLLFIRETGPSLN